MSSTSQINRANAQHSTGPKTEAGKQRSSQNVLRHGLTSQIVVMPNEDLDAYQSHVQSFVDEYQPQGATEANLVQSLADTSWRQNRIVAIESNVLMFSTMTLMPENDSKVLANLSLHSQRLARQFERTVAQLRDLQHSRLAQMRQEMEAVLDIMEIHQSKGETYNPSEDGFVFSPAFRNHRREIDEALKAAAA